MSRINWAIILILGAIIAVLVWLLITAPAPARNEPNPQTGTPEPRPFVSENVIIHAPFAGSSVLKKFAVTGEARGVWFFEASFPIQVHDRSGNIVGQGIAQTSANWMTTDFVPYAAEVEVEDYSGPATLALLKDNPSGLPENDDSVSIPIVIR